MDLRITKTYLALTNALRELLMEKSFEELTVQELCDRAMVRRATFYKHFADKYEFFAFVVREIQASYDMRQLERPRVQSGREEVEYIIRYALDYVDENRDLVRSVLQSSALEVLLGILTEQICMDVLVRFRGAKARGEDLPLDPELMANLFTGALIQGIRWWAVQPQPMDKEEVAQQITRLLSRL